MFDIKRFRKERRLTQNAFALELGYSRTAISNMESGKYPITDNFYDKLEDTYKVDMQEHKSYNQKVEDPNLAYKVDWKARYYELMEEHLALMKELKELKDHEQKLKEAQ